MTLKSIQYEEDDKTETVLNTEILYYTDKNGERVISYEESETTGMEGSAFANSSTTTSENFSVASLMVTPPNKLPCFDCSMI